MWATTQTTRGVHLEPRCSISQPALVASSATPRGDGLELPARLVLFLGVGRMTSTRARKWPAGVVAVAALLATIAAAYLLSTDRRTTYDNAYAGIVHEIDCGRGFGSGGALERVERYYLSGPAPSSDEIRQGSIDAVKSAHAACRAERQKVWASVIVAAGLWGLLVALFLRRRAARRREDPRRARTPGRPRSSDR